MDTSNRRDGVARLIETVREWPGITLAPHRFGGTQFQLGRGEIGHVHDSGLLDVPFPKPVRDELVRAGRARPHHVLPGSGWVSFTIGSEADLSHAIALLRMAYDLRHGARAGRQPTEEAVDESVEESFPASDPPAVGHEE